MNDKTLVGKIINTHGIKGNVKIYPYTDDPERFKDLDYLLIGDGFKELKIADMFIQKGFVYVRFEGYEDINKILDFINSNVYIYDKDRVKLPEDRYFISDIVNMEVHDMEGKLIGKVTDVIENLANDLYQVQKPDGKIFYLPARKEFIKEINVKQKVIIIDPIEGLLDWSLKYWHSFPKPLSIYTTTALWEGE